MKSELWRNETTSSFEVYELFFNYFCELLTTAWPVSFWRKHFDTCSVQLSTYKTEREEVLPFFENAVVVETISFCTEISGDLAETRREGECVNCGKKIVQMSVWFYTVVIKYHVPFSADILFSPHSPSFSCRFHSPLPLLPHTRVSQVSTWAECRLPGSAVINCKYHQCTERDNLINALKAKQNV